jgi:hypothetical protein
MLPKNLIITTSEIFSYQYNIPCIDKFQDKPDVNFTKNLLLAFGLYTFSSFLNIRWHLFLNKMIVVKPCFTSG